MPPRTNTQKTEDLDVSPVGWYVASYLERIEYSTEDRRNLNRRCRAWENTILVQARGPKEAYQKALRHAKLATGTWEECWYGRTRKRRHVFEGFTSFVSVDEEIEDLCEIIWIDHRNRSVRKVKSWVKPKRKLEIFCGDPFPDDVEEPLNVDAVRRALRRQTVKCPPVNPLNVSRVLRYIRTFSKGVMDPRLSKTDRLKCEKSINHLRECYNRLSKTGRLKCKKLMFLSHEAASCIWSLLDAPIPLETSRKLS